MNLSKGYYVAAKLIGEEYFSFSSLPIFAPTLEEAKEIQEEFQGTDNEVIIVEVEK